MSRQRTSARPWQVPVFVAGLCAVVGVWLGRPLWRGTEVQRFEREMAAVRHALADNPPDPDRAAELGERLLESVDRFPDRAGEVHLLVGSAYLRAAHDAPAPLGTEYLAKAREHLERADELGVPPADRAKLGYRLAKVWFATGGDWLRIVQRLEANVEGGADDAFEGYGMLVQAYLRLPTPNPVAALEASRKQLASPSADDAALAPARLVNGELLLQMKMPEQARQMLARIGPDAPPEILARARAARAQCCFDLGRWHEAARSWEEAVADTAFPPANVARVRFYLGRCYARLGKPDEAGRAWAEVPSSSAEEAQAAALARAEASAAAGAAADALRHFERAVQGVGGPDEYRNALVSLEEARALFERAVRLAREKAAYREARDMARLYQRIARPGAAAELWAVVEEAWSHELRQAKHEDEARTHALDAGAACAEVAEAALDPAARARWLRRSADWFTDGQDRARALIELKKYVRTEPAPERVAEGWLAAARVYEELKDESLAVEAYRKCIEFPGPSAAHARFRLAELDVAAGQLDDAEKMLKQNLELAHLAADDPAYEKTLLALADLLHQRGNDRTAKVYYQDALDRFPNHAGHTKTRVRLADCCHRLAVQESQSLGGLQFPSVRMYHLAEQRRWLLVAADNYQIVSRDLGALRASAPLPREDEATLRHADFSHVECLIMLGQFPEAIALCETLAARYDHQAEHLRALREMWRCYWMMNVPQNAARTLDRVRVLLRELDERRFSEYPPGESREDWYRWIQTNSGPPPAGPRQDGPRPAASR